MLVREWESEGLSFNMQIKCPTLFSSAKINHNWAGTHNHWGNLMTHFVFGSRTPNLCSRAASDYQRLLARLAATVHFIFPVTTSMRRLFHQKMKNGTFQAARFDPARCLLLRSDSLTRRSPVVPKSLSQSRRSKR